MLSNAPLDWTNRRGQLLERTRHQFFRSLDRLSITPVPHRAKLHAILFATHDEYVAFARRTGGPTNPWIAAYYDGGLNAIVLYDDRTAPWHHDASSRPGTPGSGRTLARAIASSADATTLHEAAHLLAFNCGVQRRGVDYPIWLSEGLATAFETEDVDRPFGPARQESPREARYRDAAGRDRLLPLREIIAMRDAPEDADDAATMYAQSWMLFDTLARRQPAALAAYIDALRGAPRAPIAPDAQIALFESHFGPVEALERAMARGG